MNDYPEYELHLTSNYNKYLKHQANIIQRSSEISLDKLKKYINEKESMENTKFEPFDLERALAGDKVITRNGHVVTQIVKFDGIELGGQNLSGVVCEQIHAWYENGKYTIDYDYDPSHLDLKMAPKEKKLNTYWINIYRMDRSGYDHQIDPNLYESSCDAENKINTYFGNPEMKFIKTISFEVEY